MPLVRKKVIREVSHIGHLDVPRSDRPANSNGPCLAVTDHPEAWRKIAGLNGPEWRLRSTQAEWVDMLSMGVEDVAEISAWMLARDYMDPVTAWAVDWIDPETGRFRSGAFESREEAAAKVGRTLEEEIEAFARNEGAATDIEAFRLHRRAIRKLGGWPDPIDWFQAAFILYTREVIMLKHPFVVGIWFGEPLSERGDIAPSGLLFPERAHVFTVEDEEGDDVPFLERFAGFDIASGRRQEEIERKLLWI